MKTSSSPTTREWNFIFQVLPELPVELTHGEEDLYVGWWFKKKVHQE